MKYVLTLTLLFLSSSVCFGASNFTDSQEVVLAKASIWGEFIEYPETIQAIVLTESSANVLNKDYLVGDKKLSFGNTFCKYFIPF